MKNVLKVIFLLCIAMLPFTKAETQNVKLGEMNKVHSVRPSDDNQFEAVLVLSVELVNPDTDGYCIIEVFIIHEGDKYKGSPTPLFIPANARRVLQSKIITIPQSFESFDVCVTIKDSEGNIIEESTFVYPLPE